MSERVVVTDFGKKIELTGKGRIQATKGGVVVTTLDESTAPRVKPDIVQSGFTFPAGTIESLKPLLKDVYQVTGVERDESYWLDIDAAATMTPKESWRQIRRANKGRGGITFETVAKAVLQTDPQLNIAKSWKNIDRGGVNALESMLAARILNETRAKRRKI